jgi:hypothetical protein
MGESTGPQAKVAGCSCTRAQALAGAVRITDRQVRVLEIRSTIVHTQSIADAFLPFGSVCEPMVDQVRACASIPGAHHPVKAARRIHPSQGGSGRAIACGTAGFHSFKE